MHTFFFKQNDVLQVILQSQNNRILHGFKKYDR